MAESFKLASTGNLNFGAGNVTLTHVADTGLLLNGAMQLQFNDSSQFINAPSATVLDINATDEIELNATLCDINANLDVSGTYTGGGLMTTGGNIVIPDAGTIGSSSDADAISISSTGVVNVSSTQASTSSTTGALTVGGGVGIAGDTHLGGDLSLQHDEVVLHFGTNDDVSLTHVADTGLLLNGTMQLQFNDSSQFINAPSATVLDINATDEIELNATLCDINANLDVSGTYTGGGLMTTGGNIVIPDAGTIGSSSDADAISISSTGVVNVSSTQASTSSTTGALTVGGGVGIAGDTHLGGDLSLQHDEVVLHFGTNDNVSLTHVADTGLTFTATTTATSGVKELLNIIHQTSGTPAAGIGTDIAFTVETSDGNNEKGMILEALTTDVNSNNENFDFIVKLVEGGTVSEKMRLTSAGGLQLGASNATITGFIDEDDMLTNSATLVPTQQSVKAYVDANSGGGGASALNGLSDCLKENSSLFIGEDPSSTTATASENVSVGVGALAAITTGDFNVCVGKDAGNVITDSIGSCLVGYSAGKALTSGSGSCLVGYNAGLLLNTGDHNTALGYSALDAQITGDRNTAIGYNSLSANATADGVGDNTALGCNSGLGITSGNSNTIIGAGAGPQSTSDVDSTVIIGKGAGAAAMTGEGNADGTVAIGASAGAAITSGQYNTALGFEALKTENDGDKNTAIGYQALETLNTTYDIGSNTAVGYNAGQAATTGYDNTLIGAESGTETDIRGSETAQSSNSATAIKLHNDASSADDAYNNLKITIQAVATVGTPGGEIITAIIDDYVGSTRLASLTSIEGLTTGGATTVSSSTGLNGKTYSIQSIALTTGTLNTIIGSQAGVSSAGATNCIALGYRASTIANNSISLGNSSITSLRCATGEITTFSDQRDKTNVSDLSQGLDFVNSLRPVEFTWNMRNLTPSDENNAKNGTKEIGFLAQEIQAVMPNNENDTLKLVDETNDSRLEIRKGHLIPILVKAIKDLKSQNDALAARVAALESA